MFICSLPVCCFCCFVDILVSRSLRRTPFRVRFNRHSAIMLPTHGELVLIAATNQPAVQVVDEAVGSTVGNSCMGRHPIRRVECFQRRTGRCHSGTRHCQHLHDGLGKRDLTHPPGADVLSHSSGRFGDTMLWGSWCAHGAQGWDVSTIPLAGYPELGTFVALRVEDWGKHTLCMFCESCQFLPQCLLFSVCSC